MILDNHTLWQVVDQLGSREHAEQVLGAARLGWPEDLPEDECLIRTMAVVLEALVSRGGMEEVLRALSLAAPGSGDAMSMRTVEGCMDCPFWLSDDKKGTEKCHILDANIEWGGGARPDCPLRKKPICLTLYEM